MSVEEPDKVDSYLEKPTYITETEADHGFKYQREWFLYFCLVLADCKEKTWNAGYEVSAAFPFDDIVIEFEMNRERHIYAMQVKHDKYSRQIVTNNHLLDPTSKKDSKAKEDSKGNDYKNIQTNFNINKYYKNFSLDFSSKNSNDVSRKFIILANHDYQENPCDNSTSDDSFTCPPTTIGSLERSTEEPHDVIKKLFQKLEDTRVYNNMDEQNEKPGKTNFYILKFKQITLNNGEEIKDLDFLENFRYIFKLPRLDELRDINNVIMEEQYQFRTKNFTKVRSNLFHHIREQERIEEMVQKDENGQLITKNVKIRCRNKVTMDEFDNIIYKSVLQVDLPCWSVDFLDRFPEWLNFEQDSLNKIAKDTKVYFCHGSARLMAFMVYKAHKATLKNHDKVYCICYSKFRKIYQNLHRKALEEFDRKVICFVDEFDHKEDFTAYENAIFVIKDGEQNPKKVQCSIEDLTKEAQKEFRHEKICFQGNPISLEEISCDSKIRTEILQMRFDGEVNLFSALPTSVYNDKNMSEKPQVFIDRSFTLRGGKDNMKYKEGHVYNPNKNIIIMGLAGVGKSTTMLNVAQKIKEQNPQIFVQFIELKKHSSDLSHLKEMTGKEIDIWDFFVEKFITYSTTDKSAVTVERLIISDYLKPLRPKFVVFLDGLDEVYSEYKEQIKQLIMEFKKKKIQIFISSQPHLQNDVDDLQFDVTYNLEPYDDNMQRQFLRDYWTENLQLMLNTKKVQQGEIVAKTIPIYTKKFLKMCYRSKLTDSIPSIPLLLNVIADIYLNDCMEFCRKENVRWSDRILHVDVLKIYEEIFEKLWNRYYIKTGEDQSNVLTIASKSRRIKEFREDYMVIASQNLLKSLWNGAPSPQFKVTEIELFENGFVTKNQEGDFIFIYSKFEEFFAAHWLMRKIFPENMMINLEILQYLFQKNQENSSTKSLHRGVKSFICRLMLKEISSEDFEKRLAYEKVSKILLEFLPNAWFDREMQLLEVTFWMAEKFCSPEDVENIFKGKRFFETVPFISALHLEKAIALHDQYFTKDETTKILKDREENIFKKCIMKDSNFELFKKLFEVVTGRQIYSSDGYKKKTHEYFRNYLLIKKIPNWKFVQEMFSWFFENTQKTEDAVCNEVMELLNKLEDDFKKNRFYIGHILASYYEFTNNPETFLNRVCNKIKDEKNYYRFLYAVNSITRDDFMEKVMSELLQINCDLICADGKSVIFHAFQTNNAYLLDKVLEFLPNDQIREQIAEDQGICLLKQLTRKNFLIECFVKHMINKFGDSCIPDLYRPVSKDYTSMENINFLNFIYERKIFLKILVKDNFLHFLGKFVEKLWTECIKWKLNLLHEVAKYANHPEIIDAILLNNNQ
ncbi:hypothetical protein DMENIID0001_155320 [Sergentomyia squamirostris]